RERRPQLPVSVPPGWGQGRVRLAHDSWQSTRRRSQLEVRGEDDRAGDWRRARLVHGRHRRVRERNGRGVRREAIPSICPQSCGARCRRDARRDHCRRGRILRRGAAQRRHHHGRREDPLRAFPIAVAVAIYAPIAVAAVEDDLRDGDKYFESGDLKKAAAAYDRAIAKAPGQVAAEAYGKRAAIFIILKDYKGGLAFIEKAKQRYPNAPEILEQEALILWQTDRKADAIHIAEQVVKARPQSFLNQQLIGEYYAGRDAQKTASAFEAYLQHRPS